MYDPKTMVIDAMEKQKSLRGVLRRMTHHNMKFSRVLKKSTFVLCNDIRGMTD